MTKELSESVQKIRSLSPKLNAAVQEANQVVQLLEQFLNDECRAGQKCFVDVSSEMPGDDYRADPDDYEGMWLGYDRIGGKFRIVIEENTKEVDFDTQENKIVKTKIPWSDAPKGAKLESFGSLPELLKSIADQIEESIENTTTTAKTVGEILEALKGPTAEQINLVKDRMAGVERIAAVLAPTRCKVSFIPNRTQPWIITTPRGEDEPFESEGDAMDAALAIAKAVADHK